MIWVFNHIYSFLSRCFKLPRYTLTGSTLMVWNMIYIVLYVYMHEWISFWAAYWKCSSPDLWFQLVSYKISVVFHSPTNKLKFNLASNLGNTENSCWLWQLPTTCIAPTLVSATPFLTAAMTSASIVCIVGSPLKR